MYVNIFEFKDNCLIGKVIGIIVDVEEKVCVFKWIEVKFVLNNC